MTATTPRLPLELERIIFEHAAHDDLNSIPTLLRVAHRVHVWLEPSLYRMLPCKKTKCPGLLAALKAKPVPFLSSTVRHANFFRPALERHAARDILELCPGIVNLFLPSGHAEPSLLPLLGRMHLQRLTVHLADLFGAASAVDLDHPLFRSVTHLDLFDEFFNKQNHVWMKRLSTLTTSGSLTHLALTLPEPEDLPLVQDILASSPCMQILILVFDWRSSARWLVAKIDFVDTRLVAVVFDEYEDWECGGEDMWVRAEDFVARKRRGEIQENSYFVGGGPNDDEGDVDDEVDEQLSE